MSGRARAKVGRREIARAFGIRGNDRAALTELLRALEAEGALDGRHKRRRSDGRLPAVTVLVVEGLDSDGALTGPARRVGVTRSAAADHARPRAPRRARAGGG